MSEPWPPLPTTDGATVTVTLHPHFLHAYCSPCFICIVTSLNRIGEGVDTPLSVFVHRAVSPGWLIVRREGRCIPHAFARSRTLRRETRRQRGGGHQPERYGIQRNVGVGLCAGGLGPREHVGCCQRRFKTCPDSPGVGSGPFPSPPVASGPCQGGNTSQLSGMQSTDCRCGVGDLRAPRWGREGQLSEGDDHSPGVTLRRRRLMDT
jgi:hypothetical protein